MPIEKITLLYQYEELSDEAKKKARDWFKETEGEMFGDYLEYEDFLTICEHMGVTVKMETENFGNGKSRQVPALYWTGFWSQGDGACFVGRFSAADFAATPDIRAHAGQDEKLHAIHDELAAIVSQYPALTAEIGRPYGDRYSHSHTMFITDLRLAEDDDEAEAEAEKIGPAAHEELEKDLLRLMRRLADWLYAYLEAEYEYRTGDEAAEEGILANEYTFTVDGKRED